MTKKSRTQNKKMRIHEADWIDRNEEDLRLLLPEGSYEVGEYPFILYTGKEGVITYILMVQSGLKEGLERTVRKNSGSNNKDNKEGFIL